MTNRLERLIVQVRNGDAEFSEIEKLLRDIDELQADVRATADVIGRVSVWLPHLQDNPSGAPDADPADVENQRIFQLAINSLDNLRPGTPDPSQKFRFPQLRKAIDWLIEQGIATAAELAGMTERQKLDAISAPGINSTQTLEKLRTALSESLKGGESLQEFRKRIKGEVNLLRHEEETIYRTKTKQSYVEGLDQTLNSPGVRDRFTHVVFTATDDNRVRDHHWDLDGMVAEKGSPLYRVMLAILKEWNCRCSIIPITRERAEKMGVKSMQDLPREFREEFDVSLVL